MNIPFDRALILSVVLMISTAFPFISCKKMSELADKPFEFNGQYYETLQQAVNASLFAEEDTCNIFLRGNTSGDGATVEAWNYGIVQIDFGRTVLHLHRKGKV